MSLMHLVHLNPDILYKFNQCSTCFYLHPNLESRFDSASFLLVVSPSCRWIYVSAFLLPSFFGLSIFHARLASIDRSILTRCPNQQLIAINFFLYYSDVIFSPFCMFSFIILSWRCTTVILLSIHLICLCSLLFCFYCVHTVGMYNECIGDFYFCSLV